MPLKVCTVTTELSRFWAPDNAAPSRERLLCAALCAVLRMHVRAAMHRACSCMHARYSCCQVLQVSEEEGNGLLQALQRYNELLEGGEMEVCPDSIMPGGPTFAPAWHFYIMLVALHIGKKLPETSSVESDFSVWQRGIGASADCCYTACRSHTPLFAQTQTMFMSLWHGLLMAHGQMPHHFWPLISSWVSSHAP